MSRLLFENSKMAMGFAGLTLVGAAIFAGASGSTGFIGGPGEDGVSTIAATAPTRQVTPKDQAAPTNQPEIADFAPDEELVDDALGIDPSPRESFELADPDDLDQPDARPDPEPAARPPATPGGTRSPTVSGPREVVITGRDSGLKPINPEPINGMQPIPPRPAD